MKSEAILLALDPALATAVDAIRSEILARCGGAPLAANGVSPHVTLAICDAEDPARAQAALDATVAANDPPALDLVSVGAFGANGRVVFVAPVVRASLLGLHASWHARNVARDGRPFSRLYHVGTWVPHITVGYGLPEAQLGAALEIARQALPTSGQAVGIEHVQFEASTPAVLGTLGHAAW